MSDLFVKFPDTVGNYISTADVNLLDADTAHLAQSNPWTTYQSTIFDNGILPSGWGSFRYTPWYDATLSEARADFGPAAAVPGLHTVVVRIDNKQASGRLVEVKLYTNIGNNTSVEQTVTPGDNLYAFPVTLNAGVTEVMALYIRFKDDGLASDEYVVSEVMVAAGVHTAFVPSLRIVGDLDMAAKAAAVDWSDGIRYLLNTASGAFGYHLRLDGTGLHTQYGDGADKREEASSLFNLVNGTATVIRQTTDVATGAVIWYQDGGQVDTDTMTPGAGAPSDQPLTVSQTDFPFNGDIYWAEIRDGIDGPVVARFDAQDVP